MRRPSRSGGARPNCCRGLAKPHVSFGARIGAYAGAVAGRASRGRRVGIGVGVGVGGVCRVCVCVGVGGVGSCCGGGCDKRTME